MQEQLKAKLKTKTRFSLSLLVLAVISIVTATYAWFSIANNAAVDNMTIEVTTGVSLKINTVFSTDIADYKDKVDNDMVNAQLAQYAPDGFGTLNSLRLAPLTSGDGIKLYTANRNTVSGDPGALPKTGNHLLLDLWLISSADMDIFLNADSSAGSDKANGTLITATDIGENSEAQKYVDRSVRVSLTPYYNGDNTSVAGSADSYNDKGDGIIIYEPNKDGATSLTGNAASDGGSTQQTFVDLGTNAGVGTSTKLCSLKANVPVKLVVRIWIEGEDPECVNGNGANALINIEKAKFNARFRFSGAGEDGTMLE